MSKFAWTSRVVSALTAVVASASAWAQPPVTQDYGFIPVDGTATTRSFSFGLPTTVLWAKITIQRIDAAEGAYLDIHTGTNPVAPILADTEIGLYNSTGTLIAEDDDSGQATGAGRSLLSFGSTTPRAAVPSGGIPAGVNGATLPAGVYYVAVAGYNKIFAANFSVTNSSPNNQTGNIALTVVADRFAITTPPPATDLGLVVSNRLPIAFGPVGAAGPAFVWVKFNLETGTDAATNYVDFHTNGSSLTANSFGVNDTEIAIYNASGGFVNSSDDYGSTDANSTRLSGLSFGRTTGPRTYGNLLNFAGQAGQLSAGTYYAAVGVFNLDFSPGFRVRQTNNAVISAGLIKLNIETNIGKSLDYDLGTVLQINSPARSIVFPQAAGQVRWVKFRSLVPTDAANVFLDIHTLGSDLPANDTEIGLYTANGTLFRQSDDWPGSPNNESGISFGRTTGPRTYGNMGPFAGQSGAVLIAGEYYIAITTFDSSFANGFVVNPGPLSGTVVVTVNTNAGPALAYDFGQVSKRAGTYSSPSLNTPNATTVWVKFSTAAPTNNAGRFLDINTNGSALNDPSRPTALDDSEVGLFDALGNFINSSDDWSPQDNTAGATLFNSYRSGLSYGNTVAARQYIPMRNFNGEYGSVLPAGDYYLALNGYNTSYASSFTSTPDANTSRGAIKINIITNLPATPCNVADVAGLGGSLGADGQLSADDVIAFISAYLTGNLAVADIAQLGGALGADGQLSADDLIVFLQRYFAGCF